MSGRLEIRKDFTPYLDIGSPMSGELVSLKQVPDKVFSSGIMGEGIAILPGSGSVVAPCDGAVTYNKTFCHMVGITTSDGIEILIHVGLNTPAMEHGMIHCHVKEKQVVRKGEPLLTVNLDAANSGRNHFLTMVVITNPDCCASVVPEPLGRKIRAGEKLMTVF